MCVGRAVNTRPHSKYETRRFFAFADQYAICCGVLNIYITLNFPHMSEPCNPVRDKSQLDVVCVHGNVCERVFGCERVRKRA